MEKVKTLTNTTQIMVRFCEVDSLGIVWHGHYLKYLEDGREAFGVQYGLGYIDIYNNGLVIPIVKVEVDFKRPLKYRDKVTIETTYQDCEAAKLIFSYTLKDLNGQVVGTATTIQVFLEKGVLCLYTPEFINQWKTKNLVK